MLYPEICLPGLLPSYRTTLSLVGALFLCFLNEKICQRLLAPQVCSCLAVFTLNQLYSLWSLSYFPFSVWDTSNQPLLGCLLQVHIDLFFPLSFLLLNTFLFVQNLKKRKEKGFKKLKHQKWHSLLWRLPTKPKGASVFKTACDLVASRHTLTCTH